MANITRIKNNQITDATITYAKIAAGTLTGSLFNPSLTLSSNVTILGNLSVTGNTSTINSTNTYVNDPLIVFNNGYTGTPSYDIGIIANRNLQSLAGYGNYNTGWVWVESAGQWQAVVTTETGITTGAINNSGWGNVRIGNLVAIGSNVTGAASIGSTLAVTGATTLSSTLGVTGATTLTTANVGGLQAVAIGNVTPGTGAFTTLTTSGTFISSGNIVAGSGTASTSTTTGALISTGGVGIAGATWIGGLINVAGAATLQSTLGVTGATTLTTTTTGGLQAVAIGNVTPGTAVFTTETVGGLQAVAIGNVTPGTYVFTTGSVGGLQAVAIGNVTPGTAVFTTANATSIQATAIGNITPGSGAFTTGTFSSTLGVTGVTTMTTANVGGLQAAAIGNITPGTGVFTSLTAQTETVGGLQAVAIGNVTPGTAVFTTETVGGLQAVAIGNVTPGTGVFTTLTAQTETVGGLQAVAIGNVTPGTAVFTTETVGGLQAVAIGNVTPGTGAFTTVTATTVNAVTIGNVGAILRGDGGNIGNINLGSISGTYPTANVSLYDNISTTSTNATFYPQLADKTSGNVATVVATGINVNPSTSTINALAFAGGSGSFTTGAFSSTLGVTGATTLTTATTGGLQAVAIGNATPGTGAFTTLTAQTETVGGLQAVAIGNVTPGTGAFTTVTGGSFQGIIGNATATTAFFTTANATNLYAATIGNATTVLNGSTATINNWANITGTAAATSTTTGALIVAGGIGVAGNVYSGYTITAANIVTTGSSGNISGVANLFSANVIATNINAVTIGNASAVLTGSYGNITTINATNVNAVTIGNIGASVVGNGGFLSNIIGANVTGTVTTANVSMYDNIATSTTNAVFYPQLSDKSSGNVATVVATSVNVNPSTSTISALGFVGGSGAFTTLNATGITQLTNTTDASSATTGALQVAGGVGIAGNLWVNGNVYAGNLFATTQSILTIEDPLVYLYAAGNTATYNYDIGIYSDYSAPGYRHTGVARSFASNTWTFFSNLASEPLGTTINWNDTGILYDTVKAGSLILANSTTSTSTSSGALQVSGGAGIGGNVYIGGSLVGTNSNISSINTLFATTVNAASINAVTIGNIGTYLKGDGSNITNISLGSISGTFPTANVSLYDQFTSTSTNATFYPSFFDKLTGNGSQWTASTITFNPGTGALSATSFNGVGTFSTATTSSTLIASGNIVAGSGTTSTSTTTGALISTGGVGIAGNLNIGGQVNVAGNVAFDGGQVTHYDSIIDLHTYGNLASWSSDDGKDIGLRMHYYNGADTLAFVGLENSSKSLQFLINATEVAGNVTGTFGNAQMGSLLLSNTTTSTSTTTGALIVSGGAGIAGNINIGTNAVVAGTLGVTGATTLTTATTGGLQAVAIGNVTPGTGAFTTLSTTGNLTVGGNIAVTGNIVPSANVIYSLGTSGNRFKDIWLSGQTEYLGGSVIGEDSAGNLNLTTANGNRLTISNAGNVVVTTGNISAPYHLGNVYGTTGTFLGSGTSTSTTTGAVVVTGGVGVGGNLYVGTNTAITGTLGVTGATTMTTATTGGLQAVAIGNVTPGTYTFTTGNVGGLQAVAIGNVTAGTGAFTTLTASTWANVTATVPSTSTTTGALVVAGGVGIGGNIYAGTTSSVHAFQGNLLIGPTQGANNADSPVTINQNTDTPQLFPNAVVHVSSLNGKTGFYAIDTYGTFAPPVSHGFFARRARGTAAAPSAVQAADTLGALYFRGYGSTLFATSLLQPSGISVGAAENFTDTSQATYMNFWTTNTGSNAATVSMFIDYTGNVVVNAATTSTSTTTGALTVKGGVGIAGALNIGGNTAVNSTLYAQGVYDNGTRVVSTSSGAGNLTISGNSISLTATGPGVATTGSASAIPVITTDAYGRITAISTAAVAAVATAANVALYTQTVALNNNQTFYPTFANVNGGNSIPGTSSLLTYNAGTGVLTASAAAVNGGLTSTSTTSGALVVTGGVGVSGAVYTGGAVVINSTTNSTSTGTGALQVAGGAGIVGNVYFGNAAIFNSSQTAGSDYIVRGKNDATLIWARPSATYDTVIIGNSATASTVVAGAKLNINTTDSMLLPVGTNSQRPGNQGQTDVTGMFRYSTTQNAIEWYTGTQWNSATTQFTTIVAESFNGDGTSTDFTLAGTTTTASTIVSINGIVQIPTLAYSIVSSTTLRFTEAPAVGDIIDVRRLTTTATVTALNDSTGYNDVSVDVTNGITFSTGTAAKNARYRINTDGSKVSLLANTAVASANTATTIDTVDTTVYRSAKYVVQATNGANYQVLEALLISNGTTATVMAYGTIQTNGNLGVVTATQSGSNAQLQFIALNSSTNVRITKEYLPI